jgi:Diacylglycerol acyltransferase
LRTIGIVDASRDSARRSLENYPYTIGISTGGVAEVFETNSSDECILLRERVGLIKLAIRTGADLVPCYIFGNTSLYRCWAGEGIPGLPRLLERFSRKVAGFATIAFWGRFGLPIPFRAPLLAVTGKAIPTHHLSAKSRPRNRCSKCRISSLMTCRGFSTNTKACMVGRTRSSSSSRVGRTRFRINRSVQIRES